jgi:hypothetical protein
LSVMVELGPVAHVFATRLHAPEEAAAVIEALEPGWIRNEVREELGLPPN